VQECGPLKPRGCILACFLAMLACGSAESDAGLDPAANDAVSTIEIFSWWARAGERDALGAVARVHAQTWPDDVILSATAELSGLARKTLQRRLETGEDPETFQANIGNDLLRWVRRNGADDRESKLSPLDEVMPESASTWREVFPPWLLEHASYGDKLYAVPSTVHRINTLFFNQDIFEAHGLPVPRTIADFDTIATRLAGTGIHPIAVGSREPWTLALLAFECVLVAEQPPEVYDQYFSGALAADDPRVLHSLETTRHLLHLANPDHARLSWLQALDLFIHGEAAMMVMGDWTRASIEASEGRVGEQFREIAFPGSEATFVFTSDTFPLPKRVRNSAGAKRLLRTIGSIEGQRAIAAAKASLAAHMELEPPTDPAMREKYELFRRKPGLLALSGKVPSRFAEDIAVALAEMAARDDIEPVVLTLRSRYPLLR